MKISRDLAADMMEGILEANAILGEALRDASQELPPEAAVRLKKQIAQVLGRHLVHVMNPIGELYPDLYPEALRPNSDSS